MSFLPPNEIFDFLKDYQKYLVFGHVEPDGDCVASQLVLAGFLKRMGKQTLPFSEGPFDRPEILPFKDRFHSRLTDRDLAGSTAAAVLDCSTRDRIGAMGQKLRGLPILVIDHHASGEQFGDLRWVVPEAPSVTFLIQRLIEEYPQRPTAEEARLMLFGLARDTGFFRHLSESSAAVFEAASRLVAAGASPNETYSLIHGGWELGKVRLLALSLQRAEPALEGRVLVTYQSMEDLRSAGSSAARGSDEVFRILQGVRGVDVVAFLREERQGRCSVGLRSNDSCDVGELARFLNGGGHARAAGYTADGSIAEVRESLLQALASRLRAKT
jgi:phosphoesterase RecJ-like protein